MGEAAITREYKGENNPIFVLNHKNKTREVILPLFLLFFLLIINLLVALLRMNYSKKNNKKKIEKAKGRIFSQ